MNSISTSIKLGAVLGAIILGTATGAYAQGNGGGSNGTTGGGNGVYQDGNLRLRDMVDAGTCRWESGEAVLFNNAELQARLEKVKALNWYFHLMLTREIRALDFCWTNAAIRSVADTQYSGIDRGSVLIYQTPASVPVGLRIQESREVYVQSQRYAEFGPQEKALFIIHEALHSFMNQRLASKDYYERLFSIVRTIGTITTTSTSDARSFEVAIRKSGMNVPTSSQFLTDRKYLTYLFDSYDGRREQILNRSVTVTELLRSRDYSYVGQLPDADQNRIASAKAGLQDELFQDFCMSQDAQVLNALRAQRSEKFDIDLYCLTAPQSMDQISENPAILNASARRFIQGFYAGLAEVTPSIYRDRVIVSKQLSWLTSNSPAKPNFRYALEMKPAFVVIGRDDADTRLLQYARILVAAARVQSVDDWTAYVAQDGFATAFQFTRLEALLRGLPSPIAGESLASIESVRQIYRQALYGIVIRLRNDDSDAHADAFVRLINASNLGFQIQE